MNVAAVQPQAKKPSYAKERITNGVVTLGGIGTTGALLYKGIKQADYVCSDAIALSNGSKPLKVQTGKIFKFFEKTGKQLFGPETKLGQVIKRYVTGQTSTGGYMCNPKQIVAKIKKCRTVGAMALAAGLAGLGFLVNGFYQEGKIDAKSKMA